tara:strand:+ start:522 stop:710 length:189 start_codon:yes stop_codon:yes gene_type:complete
LDTINNTKKIQMTQETKECLSDAITFFASIAVILTMFYYGQRYVNNKKAQYIQEVRVDGQGK